MTRVLLVDNHDSFTFNIAHLVAGVTGVMPDVVLNDAPHCPDLAGYTHLVIGPGPGTPHCASDAGHSTRLYAEACELGIPVLGVCFGMQLLAVAHSGRVGHAAEPMHGRENSMTLCPAGRTDPVVGALPATFTAVRYHSLMLTSVPAELEVLAHAPDGSAQAVRHRHCPAWGVQFHPESIRSDGGVALMRAFLSVEPQPTHTIVASEPLPYAGNAASLFMEFYANTVSAVWLDSASDDARSRFSYMGAGEWALTHRVGEDDATLMERLRCHLSRYRLDSHGRALAQSIGGFGLGFAGYIGYGVGEETLHTEGQGVHGLHDPERPDAVLPFLTRALVIDHEKNTVQAIALADLQGAHDEATSWVHEASARVKNMPTSASPKKPDAFLATDADIEKHVVFRHSREKYLELIAQCHGHINEGESYELCLTNEGRLNGSFNSHEVYRNLRELARVPYGAFLHCGDFSVASASPERFLEVTMGGEVESRPIKGTRPRGEGQVDEALRMSLIESEKDRAENLMIVDLVRNDLSRVCDPGTVRVPSIYAVESFPSVHQLISTVRGTLAPGRGAIDTLEASFPGGSMTGAPKLRTVQLLQGMEHGVRGVYSGAIGWISLSGALSLSIVIRTAVIDSNGATFGVGGAITQLSDPDEEYAEIITKSRTVVTALMRSRAHPQT